MSDRFFPYRTIQGDVRLEVTSVRIDDSDPTPDPRDAEKRQVYLYDQENSGWKTVAMKLEVQGPGDEIRELQGGEDIVAIAVVHCDSSHERRSLPLKRIPGEAPKWLGTLELERADYRGTARLEVTLAGTAGGLPCRFLGAAEPWDIHFDEPAVSPRTGTMEVRWVDFTSEKAPSFLRDYSAEPFYADLTGEKPALYLNKSRDFEKLPIVLDDRRRGGQDLALHNAERLGIARSVWMALLNASVAAIQEADEGFDPDWPETPWQKQVLQVLLPRIYRNQSESEALKAAYDAWEAPEGARLLESRGQAEVNRRIGAAKLLRRTLELIRSQGTVEEGQQ